MDKKCITRKGYMQTLQRLLLWKFNDKEIRDILGDYDEFFDIGISEGKSEEDVCRGLGEPSYIIEELEIELDKKKNRNIIYFTKKAAIRTVIMFLSVLIPTYIISKFGKSHTIVRDLIVCLPIFLAGIWFCMGGKSYTLFFSENKGKSFKWKKLILHHGICFFISAVLFIANYYLVFNVLSVLLEGKPFVLPNSVEPVKAVEVGPFLVNIYKVIIVMILVLFMYWITLYRKYSPFYFSLITHGIGLMASTLCYINLLYLVDHYTDLSRMLYGCLYVYITGVIMTAIFLFYLKTNMKGAK